jgi:hypothetical protein
MGMSPSQLARVASGLLVAAAGVWMTFTPSWVAATFHRPAGTVSEQINLRATFGGTLVGLGALVVALGALTPWPRTVAIAVLCLMLGIGAARVVGFVLDGKPDTIQIVWIVAELVLAAGAALYLRRAAS